MKNDISISLSDHGVEPGERDIKDYIRLGIVIIDKPKGPTSHQISAWVRKIVGAGKAGHSGTLDPKVTGVLPIAFEDAARALDVLLEGSKEYVGIMRLHGVVGRQKVSDMFSEFTGKLYQTPPVRSAVKRERRIREIYDLEILEHDGKDVLFRAECEAGTYMRTLCCDIGDALGVGGHMLELRRTKSGHFSEKEAFKLHELKDAFEIFKESGDESHLRKVIIPMEALFESLPKVYVKDSAVDAISHGADVALPGIVRIEGKIDKNSQVAVFTLKGEAIALGNAIMNGKQISADKRGVGIKLSRVFMRPGTYPRLWKRKN